MLYTPLWKRILVWALVAFGLAMAMPNLFYPRVEGHNDALKAVAKSQTAPTPAQQAKINEWPDWLPSSLVNLGLDLRGGAHLLAEVHVKDVYADRMNSLWPEVRDKLRNLRDSIGTIRRQPGDPSVLTVRISKPEGMAKAVAAVQELAVPIASLSQVGAKDIAVTSQGSDLIVQLSEAEKIATDKRTVDQTVEIIRRRVDAAGTREPTIQRQGTDRVLIEVPGVGSAAELIKIIGTTAKLTFNQVYGQTGDANTRPGAGRELLPSKNQPGIYYIVDQTPAVAGDDLTDARPGFDQNSQPAVDFRFDTTGAKKFCTYTSAHVGEPFAIVLDNEVISAPTIQTAICGGSGIITGHFTVQESTELAILLRAGALPASLSFLEQRTIGPELGRDSIEAGKVASLVAFALVVVLMWATYGWFGLVANFALVLNIAMIFAALSLIGGTLTLPGIAGIVLTIGTAVDANVLIFERIREEMRTARGPARAIELGYERALSAIVDANITTIITAMILYFMGSGPVRGFAITLGLGIATSVFTAVYVSRLIIVIWFERRRPKTIEV